MSDEQKTLDLDAIEAAVRAPGVWKAPWSSHEFEINCPCPNGEHCGDTHSCVEVEAREEYPCGAPGEPAEEGQGQCVVQISVPGLSTFAYPTADAIVALRNNADGLLAAARELATLKEQLAPKIIAYARALVKVELFDAAVSEGTANLSRERDRQASAALWSEFTKTRAELAKLLGVSETDLPAVES